MHRDHGQVFGFRAELLRVDIGGVGVDDLAHKLEVLQGVLVAVVQKSHILPLNGLFDGSRNFDFLAVAYKKT